MQQLSSKSLARLLEDREILYQIFSCPLEAS